LCGELRCGGGACVPLSRLCVLVRAHARDCAQVTATNVDIARVAPSYHLYSVEEVEAVINRL
jgi:hypothetical protein